MDIKAINHIKNQVLASGPTRVLVDSDGTSVSLKDAERQNIKPDLIYIRDDAWSLGVPKKLEAQAKLLWFGHWVAKVDINTGSIKIMQKSV